MFLCCATKILIRIFGNLVNKITIKSGIILKNQKFLLRNEKSHNMPKICKTSRLPNSIWPIFLLDFELFIHPWTVDLNEKASRLVHYIFSVYSWKYKFLLSISSRAEWPSPEGTRLPRVLNFLLTWSILNQKFFFQTNNNLEKNTRENPLNYPDILVNPNTLHSFLLYSRLWLMIMPKVSEMFWPLRNPIPMIPKSFAISPKLWFEFATDIQTQSCLWLKRWWRWRTKPWAKVREMVITNSQSTWRTFSIFLTDCTHPGFPPEC